jgi:hypothetical protein
VIREAEQVSRQADRNTGKIVIPSTIRSQASARAGPWRRGCSSIICRPGHPVTLAWLGRAPRSGGSGARGLCCCTWRAEREGRALEDKSVLVSHMRNGKFVETWQHSEDQCAADEFLS